MKNEHILVCISSSKSSEQIIERAAEMVKKFNASFTCLFIKKNNKKLDEDEEAQLKINKQLAQKQGAKIEEILGDDIAVLISEFARMHQITKIFIGDGCHHSFLFKKESISQSLVKLLPSVEVYVIPSAQNHLTYEILSSINVFSRFSAYDFFMSALILTLSTIIGFFFSFLGFTEANIIVIYILGVLIISVVTHYRIYSLISSIVSVLVFNYFFTIPHFSLEAYDSGYPVTFFVMFLSAFITSSLAGRLKSYAKESNRSAFTLKALLETNQMLQKTDTEEDILEICASQLVKSLGRDVIIYGVHKNKLTAPVYYPIDSNENNDLSYLANDAIVEWVFKHNHQAGFGTNRYSNSRGLYLAIRVNTNVYGVVAIDMSQKGIHSFENNLILSIIGESALALENQRTRREKKETELLARNEQLRANLLRSISHDLRTPLTTISGNANNLMINSDLLDEKTKLQLYTDIYNESLWLINLVENLLSVTRLEGDSIKLNLTAQLVDDVIEEAVKHVSSHSANHKIHMIPQNHIVLVMMDVRLIVQVLINLIDNAIKYSDENTTIEISYYQDGNLVYFIVADQGRGIRDEEKNKVFEMFYTGGNKVSDCRRSMGLGLFLCKSVVNAHGGRIWVEDNQPTGSKFIFTLPVKEVEANE